jgi:hypothetical protein
MHINQTKGNFYDVHVLGLYALSLKILSSGLAKTFFTKKKHSSIILEAMANLWGSTSIFFQTTEKIHYSITYQKSTQVYFTCFRKNNITNDHHKN